MKSLLAGQPLPRPSQAAVFHSCAVREGELPPLVMWAELLARSAPAQPNPVFAMSILLGCPLLLWVWKCPWDAPHRESGTSGLLHTLELSWEERKDF